MDAATMWPKITSSSPSQVTDSSLHSRWALHSAISGGVTARGAQQGQARAGDPLGAVAAGHRPDPLGQRLGREVHHELPRAFGVAAVAWERWQPKASTGPPKAIMETKLLGAMLGSPAASTVDTSTMGPGSTDRCQSALSTGKATLAARE